MKHCEWCGAEFEPNDSVQVYCKPRHSKNARLRRKRDKDLLAAAGKCPTPNKRVWIDDPNAKNWNLPSNQYLYHCRCGAIHAATTKTPEKAAA